MCKKKVLNVECMLIQTQHTPNQTSLFGVPLMFWTTTPSAPTNMVNCYVDVYILKNISRTPNTERIFSEEEATHGLIRGEAEHKFNKEIQGPYQFVECGL